MCRGKFLVRRVEDGGLQEGFDRRLMDLRESGDASVAKEDRNLDVSRYSSLFTG